MNAVIWFVLAVALALGWIMWIVERTETRFWRKATAQARKSADDLMAAFESMKQSFETMQGVANEYRAMHATALDLAARAIANANKTQALVGDYAALTACIEGGVRAAD